MRWRGAGYGETFGEMMVSGGSALKFQRETEHPDFADERRLSPAKLVEMAALAKDHLHRSVAEDPDFLERVADRYQLGLPLIEAWSAYTRVTAAAASQVPPEDVLSPWKHGDFDIAVARRPTIGPGSERRYLPSW